MDILELEIVSLEDHLNYEADFLQKLEENDGPETLMFWESPELAVVLGRSNKPELEVQVKACERDGVEILRRCSGGGTVLQGPGCLNYSLFLDTSLHSGASTIQSTNKYVMENHCQVFKELLGRDDVRVEGVTDLALGDLKFSGNAQRRLRRFLLFHGTFLYGFDLSLIERYLKHPTREPDYRASRGHGQFITTVPVGKQEIASSLKQFWGGAS